MNLEDICMKTILKYITRALDLEKLHLPWTCLKKLYVQFDAERETKFNEYLYEKDVPEWIISKRYNTTSSQLNMAKFWLNDMRENWINSHDWTVNVALPKDIYAHIMAGGNTEIYAIGERNHMILQFWEIKNKKGYWRVCRTCFYNHTYKRGDKLTVQQNHRILSNEQTCSYFVTPTHWCYNCITTPLFKVYDEDLCRNEWNTHTRFRWRSETDSFWDYDTDDDSDIDINFLQILPDPE